MRTWVYSYMLTSDGDIVPWLERVEYYASRTTTDTVWCIDVYRHFPRKREQKNTNIPNLKENADGHASNTESALQG